VNQRKILAAGATGLLAVGVAACGSASKSPSSNAAGAASVNATLNGAGSTFAAPVYQTWGSKLGDSGLKLNYQATGSGAGVASLGQGTVDFAGSDPALTPDDVKALSKGKPLQIPMFFGGITISYNVPGLQKGLKLDGKTAADIFLKKITTWSDPAIKALNPGVNLPSSKITVVHRSDSSGTTKGFTTFLSESSSQFKSTVGADKDVKWPAGETGAKGNDGVAAAIKQTQGAVGYVEQAYALQNNFTYAAVKNSSGKYVEPTLQSVSAAGEGVKVPQDLGISIINSPNAAAYPIASQTFIDVYQDMCKAGASSSVAKGTKLLIDYGLGAGQGVAKQLQFAPLPSSIMTKAKAAADRLQCNGSPVTTS
jgi:phosphate transport system substrate-binding protein